MSCELIRWACRVRVARWLTPAERRVLIYLAECVTDGLPSQLMVVIAADTELSVRTAVTAIQALEHLKLIRIEKLGGRNTYFLNAQIVHANSASDRPKEHANSARANSALGAKIALKNPGIPTRARVVEDNLLSSKTLVVPETLTGENLSPPPSLEIQVEISTTSNQLAIEKPIADYDLFSEITTPQQTSGTRASKPTNDARTASIDEAFEVWWESYPRKIGKKNARDQYAKAANKLDPASLLDALRTYPFKSDLKFIVYPERWLKYERWNDDHETLARERQVEPQHRRGEMVLMPDGSRVPTGGF